MDKEEGLTPEFAAKEADKFIAQQEPSKAMDYYGAAWRDKWMVENPDAAMDAWRWGYWNPNADQAAWLNQVASRKN